MTEQKNELGISRQTSSLLLKISTDNLVLITNLENGSSNK